MLKAVDNVNPSWKRYFNDPVIGVKKQPIITQNDKIFLLGSCFAERMRNSLVEHLSPRHVVPNFKALKYDRNRISVDELPGRNHMNFYNAFSILQEIERILGLWEQDPEDYWELKGKYDGKFQDPYRRMIIGDTREIVHEATTGLTEISRQGFEVASHFIFTMGMTEVFVNKRTGLVANQKPGYFRGGGEEQTEFKASTFQENLDCVLRISDLIKAEKPDAKIFVTVSPVSLSRTFSGDDIFVANTLSKSTLRAVLGEAVRMRDNLIYMPSYEAVMEDPKTNFGWDGRHIQRETVAHITKAFVDAFIEQPEKVEAAE